MLHDYCAFRVYPNVENITDSFSAVKVSTIQKYIVDLCPRSYNVTNGRLQ